MTLVSSRLASGDARLRELALPPKDAVEDWPYPPSSMNDEFVGTSLDAKWTWLDQGGMNAYVKNGRLLVTLNESLTRLRGIYQSTPSGSWSFRAKLYAPPHNYNDLSPWGLMAAQSTTQEVRVVGFWGNNTANIHALTYTNPSTLNNSWSLSPRSYAHRRNPSILFAQLDWDGTNLSAHISYDGIKFTQLASSALGYTPALVGLAFGSQTGKYHRAEAEWFRRVS